MPLGAAVTNSDTPSPPAGPFVLTVHGDAGDARVALADGQSVRDALDTTTLRVRAACGGTGSCGACVVRLLAGDVNPPTTAEYLKLPAEERQRGMRLACQLRPRGDAAIVLDDPAPPSPWHSIPAEDLAPPPGRRPELARHVYGLAVDLGTSHIRIALWDRRQGRRVATRRGPNPQGVHGADVLNRLAAAGAGHAEELAGAAHQAIVQALRDILARDMGEVTPMLAEIGAVVVVGNTAMLALLTGQGGGALLDPDTWQRPIDVAPRDPAAWHAAWPLPHAGIIVVPPLAGFIGSDLTADLIATRLAEGPPGSLLLDIGTNTEIALWDGAALHITSVPGGPAFEAVGIRNGMAAETGAIHHVTGDAAGLRCAIIGGGAPRGFCGSGLLDGIAALLRTGALKPSGRFTTSPGRDGLALVPGDPRTAITGQDIDAFQRAKAATAAGMAELLRRAGMAWQDVRRLCVCGAFGRHLDIGNAQALGLLPTMAADRIELSADAALAGCERMLLSQDPSSSFHRLAVMTAPVNLSIAEGYEECYIDHLRLRPIAMTSPGRTD